MHQLSSHSHRQQHLNLANYNLQRWTLPHNSNRQTSPWARVLMLRQIFQVIPFSAPIYNQMTIQQRTRIQEVAVVSLTTLLTCQVKLTGTTSHSLTITTAATLHHLPSPSKPLCLNQLTTTLLDTLTMLNKPWITILYGTRTISPWPNTPSFYN